MQKNWYILYTKPKCEKKVANLLTTRKIENFCPYNCKRVNYFTRTKLIYEPLFPSYVFVFIINKEISLFNKFENVVSIVSWKCLPAVVKDKEIQAIKEFVANYREIKLERIKINLNGESGNIDGNSNYKMNGKILRILNKSFQVNLPSLGFTMIAEIENESISGKVITLGSKEIMIQS